MSTPLTEKNGAVLVDGWAIPADRAQAYLTAREQCARVAMQVFTEKLGCAQATRQWAGSQDGEAVTGLDASGALLRVYHLDPPGIEDLCAALRKGTAEDFLRRNA